MDKFKEVIELLEKANSSIAFYILDSDLLPNIKTYRPGPYSSPPI